VKREKDEFFGRLAQDVRARAERRGMSIEVEIRPGHAAELIPRVAKERGADLIVLGHRGHFLRDHLLGSTADRVAARPEPAGEPFINDGHTRALLVVLIGEQTACSKRNTHDIEVSRCCGLRIRNAVL